jgi:ribonuclease HII
MVKILGIDEAGRGPVMGPLVMAGVMINEEDQDQLGEVKDSKLLSHGKRMQLDKQIREIADFKVIEVEPEEIDAALLSEDLNLNWLEAHKQAEIINELQPDQAIIDCPSTNCEAYEKYLKELIPNKNIKLIVENKADMNYKTCSAGSILAKVRREERVQELKDKFGDTGSGYPADPKTKEFIKHNWNKHPEIFRKTWSTFKKIAESEKQNQQTLF